MLYLPSHTDITFRRNHIAACLSFFEAFSHIHVIRIMDELIKSLTQIELTADDIIDTKQQIIHSDARRHKSREALSQLKELREKDPKPNSRRHWVCIGDMFIRLNANDTKNWISEDHYQAEKNLDKLRDELKEKVIKLRYLEGRPELTGLSLKPLNKKEILALRTAFKI